MRGPSRFFYILGGPTARSTFQSMHAIYFYWIDESFASELSRTVYSTFVKVCIWGGLSCAFAYITLIVVWEYFIGGKIVSMESFVSIFTVGGILVFIISPLIEEILFRGGILNELVIYKKSVYLALSFCTYF